MTSRSTPAAGGFFIFIGTIIGLVVGASNGALALGMFAGFTVGVAIAAIIWVIGRRRV